MNLQALPAYCFECLSAKFDQRDPTALSTINEQWSAFSEAQKSDKTISDLTDETIDDTRYPLFVTWNTLKKDRSSLRGCIGTFEPHNLNDGLKEYANIAAFQDHRFRPISQPEISSLQVCVTLLCDFEPPVSDPLDWEVGVHGLRIKFLDQGRRRGATYLPDVAKEQGWSKEEAVISLMRKAEWNGDENKWRDVDGFELIRYKGEKVSLDYADYKAFQAWAEKSET